MTCKVSAQTSEKVSIPSKCRGCLMVSLPLCNGISLTQEGKGERRKLLQGAWAAITLAFYIFGCRKFFKQCSKPDCKVQTWGHLNWMPELNLGYHFAWPYKMPMHSPFKTYSAWEQGKLSAWLQHACSSEMKPNIKCYLNISFCILIFTSDSEWLSHDEWSSYLSASLLSSTTCLWKQ